MAERTLWSKYGRLASVIPFTFGKVFFVLNTSDTTKTDTLQWLVGEKGIDRVYTSLESAYAACTTNQDDVIILNSHNAHDVAAQIAWSKNRIHVFGLDWLMGIRHAVQQGARIHFTLGTEAISAPMLVTGVRNSFHGIKIMNNSTNAAALYCHVAAGEGSVYEDCSFVFEVADNLDLTTSTELLCGEDAGTFTRCSFGTDVLVTSGARAVVTLDAVSGSQSGEGAKSNRFVDCEFVIMTSEANAVLLKVADTAGAKFLNRFVNPSFCGVLCSSAGGVAPTVAVASASGLVDGCIAIEHPRTMFVGSTCTTADQIEIVAPAVSSNAHEGTTPA